MAKTQFTDSRQPISYKRILGTAVALLVSFLLLASAITVAGKYLAIRKHVRDLEAERATLEEKQRQLIRMNAYLATPEGTEQSLRDKYTIARPGEGVIVVNTGSEVPSVQRPSSPVSRFWDALLRGIGLRK